MVASEKRSAVAMVGIAGCARFSAARSNVAETGREAFDTGAGDAVKQLNPRAQQACLRRDAAREATGDVVDRGSDPLAVPVAERRPAGHLDPP